MNLESKSALQIQKPINEVFEGIVDPQHICKYFLSESSGRLESAKEVEWKFPEFPDRFPITEVKVESNRSISFVWDPETVVSIRLEAKGENETLVSVKEAGKELNDENLKWLSNNSGGWANFLACLKAYLEYNINLRKGAFEFMKK